MELNKEQEDWLREYIEHCFTGNRNANSHPTREELLSGEHPLFLEAGYAVKHLPDWLKTEALCLAAVQQDANALQYVPDALKTEAVCLAAK